MSNLVFSALGQVFTAIDFMSPPGIPISKLFPLSLESLAMNTASIRKQSSRDHL